MSFLENLNAADASGASLGQRTASTANNAIKDGVSIKASEAVYNTDNPRDAALAAAAAKVAQGGLNAFLNGLLEEQKDKPKTLYTNGDESFKSIPLSNISDDMINFHTYGFNELNDTAENHPAMKHMFMCEFTFHPEFAKGNEDLKRSMKSINAFIKNTSFPSVVLETNTYNQYNRRKVHARKLQFQDVSVSIGEVVNHYGKDGDKVSVLDFWYSLMKDLYNDMDVPMLQNGEANPNHPFGHKSGKSYTNPLLYFDIFIIWPTRVKRIRLVNPYISNFGYDGFDYSADDQVIVNMNLTYDNFSLDQYDFDLFGSAFNKSHGWQYLQNNSIIPINDMPDMEPMEDKEFKFKEDRDLNLDNPLAQSLLDIAESEGLQAAASNLNSNDPMKQLLGQTAMKVGMDVAASAGSAAGGGQKAWDSVTGGASKAGSSVRGLIV